MRSQALFTCLFSYGLSALTGASAYIAVRRIDHSLELIPRVDGDISPMTADRCCSNLGVPNVVGETSNRLVP
jgi:hypothetical protein